VPSKFVSNLIFQALIRFFNISAFSTLKTHKHHRIFPLMPEILLSGAFYLQPLEKRPRVFAASLRRIFKKTLEHGLVKRLRILYQLV
jgi:hypothetical protein